MGLFSAFMRQYRVAEQRSRAERGVSTPSMQELSGAISSAAETAGAETAGRTAQAAHELGSKALTARDVRFGAELKLGQKRLQDLKEAAAGRLALGQERLGLEERILQKGRQVWPWALAVQAGAIGTELYGAAKQRERDALFRRKMLDMLKKDRKPASTGEIHQDPYEILTERT